MEQINTLIKDNEGLIYAVINKLNYIPERVEKDELLQIGRVALWKALESFDNNKGCKLSSYCYRTIRFEIMNYLREVQAFKRVCHSAQECCISQEAYNNVDEEVGFNMLVDEIKKHISSIDTQMLIDKHVNKLSNRALEKQR